MNLLVNVGANLVSALIGFLIGRAWERFQREMRSRRAKRFWRPFVADNIQVVLGQVHGLTERTGFLAIGNARALATLQVYFGSLKWPDLLVEYDDSLAGDTLKSNLIVIGGPAVNEIAKEVLAHSQLTLNFGTPAYPVAVYDSVRRREYVPTIGVESNDIGKDYGIVLRTTNPFDPSKQILVIAGSWGFGTWAGARLLTSRKIDEIPVASGGKSFECLFETDVLRGTPQDIKVVISRAL